MILNLKKQKQSTIDSQSKYSQGHVLASEVLKDGQLQGVL